jgi:hypothetical protein
MKVAPCERPFLSGNAFGDGSINTMKTVTKIFFGLLLSFAAGCGSDAATKQNGGGGEGSPSPDLGPPTVEFLMAALSNNVLEIKRHIASGTDLEQRDPNPQGNQSTALMMAAAFGHAEVAHLLMEAGVHLNAKNKDGDTALHSAAFLCHPEIVEDLLSHGADAGLSNLKGSTPADGLRLPWPLAKGIYDLLNAVLFTPMQQPLDIDRIEKTREETLKLFD